ncbi:MAG: tetratricopeptide repeat protein [Planctomycetota bacterium]|jgi:tetratricopeptide (TPR) repeat protein
MSKLLEILGRAITVDTADLIWNWLDSLITAQNPQQAGPLDRLGRIVALVEERKADAAEDQLKLYLFDNPSCICGRLAAAAMALSRSNLEPAVEELSSVYLRQPNNTMALYALGHCCERLQQESKAVEFYQDCLKFKSHLDLPRQRLAAIYFKNGQLEKTIQEYELLKDDSPDDISTLLTLGHLYIANGRHGRAIETFNTAILIHPDYFHSADGDIDRLMRDGQLQEALEWLDQLLQEHPDRPDLALRRADILNILGLSDQALSQYEEVVAACPDFLEATIKLGTQYLQTHQEPLAARQFNRGVELNDQIVDAYLGLAQAQKLAGKPSDAAATLSLAAAIQPNSSLLFAETAILQFKATLAQTPHFSHPGQSYDLMPSVIQAHETQIARRPQNPDLRYRLGLLLMGVGRINEALHAFQTALNINPTYARARTKLAVALFETGQHTLALEQLTHPDCLDADTLALHYKTALLYCDSLKFASSLINLERTLEKNFACPDATINVSIVLQNLGLLDRATAMWDNLSQTADQALTDD